MLQLLALDRCHLTLEFFPIGILWGLSLDVVLFDEANCLLGSKSMCIIVLGYLILMMYDTMRGLNTFLSL